MTTKPAISTAPVTYNEDGDPTTIIERIYTTKGDNVTDHHNVICDKGVGVVIGGDIYWLEDSFARFSDLEYLLSRFNVIISDCGQWGVKDEYQSVTFTNRVTKLTKHHDEIWCKDSSYAKRSKRNAEGRAFWKVVDLFNHFYNKPADEEKPFLQGEILEWRNEFNVLQCDFRGLLDCNTKAVVVVNGLQMPAPVSELHRIEQPA